MATTPTTKLALNKQDAGDANWEVALNAGFDNADSRFLRVEAIDNPNGGTTDGDYVGQCLWATNKDEEWRCTATGVGTSTWVRVSNDMVSLGDYVTLASTATEIRDGFEAAFADADAVNSAGVFVPPGTWTTAGNITLEDGARLFGAGVGISIIELAASQDLPMFDAAAAVDDIAICNLTLDGNSANQTVLTSHGLSLLSGIKMVFKDLLVRDFRGTGMILANAATATNLDEIHIENVRIEDCFVGGLVCADTTLAAAKNIIRNLVVQNCLQTAASRMARLRGTWHIDGLKIIDDNTGISGVGLELVEDSTNNADPDLQDCARYCRVTGLEVRGAADDLVAVRVGGHGNTLDGGYFDLPAASNIVNVFGIVTGETSKDHIITGLVFGAGISGLVLNQYTEDVLISNCTFRGITTGINVTGDRTIVTDCVLIGGTTGILIGATANDSQVKGCTFSGYALASEISDSGTDSKTWRDADHREQSGTTTGTNIDLEPTTTLRTITTGTIVNYTTMDGKQLGRRIRILNNGGVNHLLNSPDHGTPGEFRFLDGAVSLTLLDGMTIECIWDGTNWLVPVNI